MVVSNIGITPDLSAIYTSNSGMHTAFIQVSLKEEHKTSSFVYMQQLREKFATDFPEVNTYFQTGGLVDSVVTRAARTARHPDRRQRSAARTLICPDPGDQAAEPQLRERRANPQDLNYPVSSSTSTANTPHCSASLLNPRSTTSSRH